MADLLGGPSRASRAEVADEPPAWWARPIDADGGTLIRVSFWVSALASVLDAVDAAARASGAEPAVYGSAGAGLLYLHLPAGMPAVAEFVSALRSALRQTRGSVVVLAAPVPVRAALAEGAVGPVPSLSLMRAVKDQFDPGHLM